MCGCVGAQAEAWLRGRTPRTASAAVKRTHAEAGFTEARSPKLHTVERARARCVCGTRGLSETPRSRLTSPRAPTSLHTPLNRAVTTGPRTREERELEELRAIGQFKAHPLSRKVSCRVVSSAQIARRNPDPRWTV